MKPNPNRFITADFILIFISVSLVYIAALSKFYNFDGVACAIAVELADFKHLFHGNHLIYGFIGFLFDRFVRILGFSGMSVTSLQLMNVALSAVSISIFYLILFELSKKRFEALLFSLFTAFSFGYWFWAMEAQVYPLAYAPMLAIAYLGAKQSISKNIYLVAFLHLLAVSAHIIHFLFTPVILCLIYFETAQNPDYKSTMVKYAAVLSGLFLLSYAAVLMFVIKPESFRAFLQWFYASAALTPDKSFMWHGDINPLNFIKIIKTNYALFLPFNYGYISAMADLNAIGLTKKLLGNLVLFSFAVLVVLNAKKLFGEHKKYCLLSIFWLLPYLVVLSTWEPGALVYSLTNIFPVMLIVFLAFAVSNIKWKKIYFAFLFLIMFFTNYSAAILPLSVSDKNPVLKNAYLIKNTTPEHSVIILNKNMDKIYIPYFANRHPFYAEWLINSPANSIDRLNELMRAATMIYVMPDVTDNPQVSMLLKNNFNIESQILKQKPAPQPKG